jgi:adenine deaminase
MRFLSILQMILHGLRMSIETMSYYAYGEGTEHEEASEQEKSVNRLRQGISIHITKHRSLRGVTYILALDTGRRSSSSEV